MGNSWQKEVLEQIKETLVIRGAALGYYQGYQQRQKKAQEVRDRHHLVRVSGALEEFSLD